MEIKYTGVAASICTRCNTVILVVTTNADHIARIPRCPAVGDGDYFCDAPMVTLEQTEVGSVIANYQRMENGSDRSATDCIHEQCEACDTFSGEDE